MITQLTPAQIARFPEFVDKWTSIGLSTAPADRPRAEAALQAMYAQAGLQPPHIVWCGSPLGNAMTRAVCFDAKSIPPSVRARVRTRVRTSVWDSVWASVADSVWASVADSLGASVRDSVYGQHDANWLAFYDFFNVVMSLTSQTEPLCGLLELAQSSGWALPHEGIVWVSERPRVLRRNVAGRLHCDGGPAVEYPDGWQIHALNGVRVSKAQAEIPGSEMDPAQVLAEPNAEVRRELIRKVGIDPFTGQFTAP